MSYGIRRLAFEPARKLLRPEKHLEALAKWSDSFVGVFPEGEYDGYNVVEHWHLPVDDRLVNPPWAKREHQSQALQLLLDAATHVRRARPKHLRHQRVYVAISWPDLSDSQFGVFIDEEYGRSFETRTHISQVWTPLDRRKRSLARELGLKIPRGFTEAGYHERSEEEDEDAPGGVYVYEAEVWMIREPLPKR